MRPKPLAWIERELAALEHAGLRRSLRALDSPQGPLVTLDGRQCVNFGSNDYLGLAAEPRVVEAAIAAAREFGWGAGASPLVVGRTALHARLERRLAEFEGTEAALVFASGYAANMGVVSALAGRSDAIYSDELNHASLIDGCRLSRAAVHVYPHGNVAALEEQLRQSAARYRHRLIVTDGLFSMDGDLAPLEPLADLADRYDCALLVDEAHATGVWGASGRGVAEHLGVEARVAVRVGTLSKALGSVGGFVCGSRELIDWLVNLARPYIFSTALPAAAAAAALAALDIVATEPERRRRVDAVSRQLREALLAAGYNLAGSQSQIIPLVLGDAETTVARANQLLAAGFLAPAIRPPSVPAGGARLRIAVTAVHETAQISALIAALTAPPAHRAP